VLMLMLLGGSIVLAQTREQEELKAQQKKEQHLKQQEMEAKMKELEVKREQLRTEREQMREQEQQFRAQVLKRPERWSVITDMDDLEHLEDLEIDFPHQIYMSTGDQEPFVYIGGQNQSQLTLRNSFNGGSDTSKGEFEVEMGTRSFRCTINGKTRSGSIYVEVKYPDGKVFKELNITSAAEVSFSQSRTIQEDEEDKYIGTWSYVIKADKAEGNYSMSILTR